MCSLEQSLFSIFHADLPGDFQGEVEGLFGGGTADGGFAFGPDAFDEVAEFQFEGFFFVDGDGFAHDFFAGEFTDHFEILFL